MTAADMATETAEEVRSTIAASAAVEVDCDQSGGLEVYDIDQDSDI